ncbi:MAG: DUF2079 domain-containing protein, partial [Nitrososphaerota archaeon]
MSWKIGITRRSYNYLLILTAVTYAWIVLDSLFNATSIYNLSGNFYKMDTVTFVQSFNSIIFSHLPFVNNIPGGSFFAVHASPILYVLIPFYSMSPGFPVLYVIQAVILYSPTIPLYLIAKRKMENELNAFLIALTYLFYNAIFTSTFEVLSLFAGFFIFAYYFHIEKKIVPFLIFFILAISTMEFAPILGGMFGLVVVIENIRRRDMKNIFLERNFTIARKYLYGISLIIISVAFFYLDLRITQYFSHGTHSALEGLYGTNVFSSSSLLQGLLTARNSKLQYIANINSPYLYISFLDPIALMQIPWYLAIWVSVFPYYGNYYESYTFPFVVLGAISGIARIAGIPKAEVSKKMITRVLVLLILVMMIITWVAGPMFSFPSNVSEQGVGVTQVASVIPSNASVYSDVNSYPIISSKAWNTTTFGSPRNYTVFNAESGPPYSMKGYGLYAASGTYLAYKKNFNSTPVLNDFYYENSSQASLAGTSFSYATTLYMPKGSYEISANFVERNTPGVLTINPGQTTNRFFYVSEQAVQEFEVNETIQADYIVINVVATYGVYGFGAKLSTSMNPYASSIAETSFSNYAINVRDIVLNGPFTLTKGTEYYLWIYTSGYPGGIWVPTTTGTGLYEENSTTGVISSINGSMQFSVVGNIPGYAPKHTVILFNYLNGNQSLTRAVFLTPKGYKLTLNVTSNGNFSIFSFLSNYAYGSFSINPLVIKAKNGTEPRDLYLQNINSV